MDPRVTLMFNGVYHRQERIQGEKMGGVDALHWERVLCVGGGGHSQRRVQG